MTGLTLLLGTTSAGAQAPTVAYQWSAATWLAQNTSGQFVGTAITNPDGTEGAQISVSTASQYNHFNNIFVHDAGLVAGQPFTAVVTFSIATQTTYPTYFTLFARNSMGTQYDITQNWGGLAGALNSPRQIVLPMNLPAPFVTDTTSTLTASGATTITLASTANLVTGMAVTGTTSLHKNTTIASISGNTVKLNIATTGTITSGTPLTFTGSWTLSLGIYTDPSVNNAVASGAINLNSVVVYSGLSSDGVHPFTQDLPTLNATPANTLPAGFVSASGYTAFNITAPQNPVTTVSLVNDAKFVADYAGAPLSVAQENAAELQSKINSLPANQACELLLPAGTYRLAPNSVDSPNTTAGFTLSSLTNLTVNGQGAVLVMEGLTTSGEAFSISGCSDVLFENVSFDWDWNTAPIADLATVSNISSNGYQADFTFNSALSSAEITSIQNTPWTSLFQMDPTHIVRNNNLIYTVPSGTTIATGSAANVLHVTFPTSGGLPPLVSGASYGIRHYYYNMAGFKVGDCNNFEFLGVTIYSMPGMGWLLEDHIKNFEFYNCQISRTIPGSYSNNYPAPYTLTTAADGIHFDQSQGNLLIENCNLTGTGDDAMNIHDNCYQYNVVAAGANSITLQNCESYTLGNLTNGDALEFYNADFSYLGTSSTPDTLPIASFTTNNTASPPYVTINFNSGLPSGLTSQSIVRDDAYETSNVRISGNTIQYTNGRGILFSGDNATIASNFIRGIYSAPLVLETEIVQMLWAEGHGATNVVINANTLEDCNQQGRYDGAYIYTECLIPWGQTTMTMYDELSITNNVFYDCPGPALSLTNCANVLASGNQMRLGSVPANLNLYAATFMVADSYELALGGNQWINLTPSSSSYGVIYDPATTSSVSPDLNSLTNSY